MKGPTGMLMGLSKTLWLLVIGPIGVAYVRPIMGNYVSVTSLATTRGGGALQKYKDT